MRKIMNGRIVLSSLRALAHSVGVLSTPQKSAIPRVQIGLAGRGGSLIVLSVGRDYIQERSAQDRLWVKQMEDPQKRPSTIPPQRCLKRAKVKRSAWDEGESIVLNVGEIPTLQ
jgi:hypothetical protein